jgi:hypothetical protein
MTKCKFFLLLILLAPFPIMAAEAHVHGVATLQLALDDSLLHLNLSSPLDSLLGFEHQPRTEKQKTAVRHMADQLHQAERLFQPTVAARCTLKTYSLESPVLETGKHNMNMNMRDMIMPTSMPSSCFIAQNQTSYAISKSIYLLTFQVCFD